MSVKEICLVRVDFECSPEKYSEIEREVNQSLASAGLQLMRQTGAVENSGKYSFMEFHTNPGDGLDVEVVVKRAILEHGGTLLHDLISKQVEHIVGRELTHVERSRFTTLRSFGYYNPYTIIEQLKIEHASRP